MMVVNELPHTRLRGAGSTRYHVTVRILAGRRQDEH
jgi:hypothetical protein